LGGEREVVGGLLRRLRRLRADCIFLCFLHEMQKKRRFRAAKMQSVLHQLRWLRAAPNLFWLRQNGRMRCSRRAFARNLKCRNFKFTEVENSNEALKTQKSPQHDRCGQNGAI